MEKLIVKNQKKLRSATEVLISAGFIVVSPWCVNNEFKKEGVIYGIDHPIWNRDESVNLFKKTVVIATLNRFQAIIVPTKQAVTIKNLIMKTPINFPCVMLELHENPRIVGDLKKVRFDFIKNESEFLQKKETYIKPIICHYYAVINEAVEILGLKFCYRLNSYIPITQQ